MYLLDNIPLNGYIAKLSRNQNLVTKSCSMLLIPNDFIFTGEVTSKVAVIVSISGQSWLIYVGLDTIFGK